MFGITRYSIFHTHREKERERERKRERETERERGTRTYTHIYIDCKDAKNCGFCLKSVLIQFYLTFIL